MAEQRSRSAAPEQCRQSAAGARVGVLFVHGVGTAAQSDTLIDFGGALVGWLTRWYSGHAPPDPDPPLAAFQVTRARLSFEPYDGGDADADVPHMTIELPEGQTWVCAEAWWAYSGRPVPFHSMLLWSFRHLAALTWHLAESRIVRLRYLQQQRTLGALPEAGYCLFLILGYLLVALVGYLLLVPLFILAQIPYPPFQSFVLLTLLKPFLQYNASELRLFVEDDIQAANMCRKVAQGVEWLVQPTAEGGGGCSVVTIVAHSGGAWVVYDMLTADEYQATAAHVRRFITLGNGLNKAWELNPTLPRLRRTLRGNIYWLDFWGSYDPVPIHWMDPPRERKDPGLFHPGGDDRPWITLYDPVPAIKKWLEPRYDARPPRSGGRRVEPVQDLPSLEPGNLRYWPESRQVTNRMDPLTDHGGYFSNDEEVFRRIAAEIDTSTLDEPRFEQSRYWCSPPSAEDGQARRRARVAVLATLRAVAVIVAFIAIVLWHWPLGGVVQSFAPVDGLINLLADIRRWADAQTFLPAGTGDAVLEIEYGVRRLSGAVVASLVGLLPFLAIQSIWEAFDLRARRAEVRDPGARGASA